MQYQDLPLIEHGGKILPRDKEHLDIIVPLHLLIPHPLPFGAQERLH